MLLWLGACGALVWNWTRTKAKRQRILDHGINGEATILRMERTLMVVGNRPVYDFLLEFKVPGHPIYRRQHRSRALKWNASLLEPGVRLKVKVDPNDPLKFLVVGTIGQQRPQNVQSLVAVSRGYSEASAVAPSVAPSDPVKALKDLQTMLDGELITQGEYDQKKAAILARM